MKFFIIAVAAAVVFGSAAAASAKTTSQFDREIKDKSQNLEQLQKSIKEKRLEKEKCLLEEKTARRELGRIESDLDRIQKQGTKLRREIKQAEQNVYLAAKEMNLAGWEKKQWLSLVSREIDLWYRAHHSVRPLYVDLTVEQARLSAITAKRTLASDAERKEQVSQKSIERWRQAQKRLTSLKEQHEKTLVEQSDVKKQKEEFLKTTIGRRVVAEEEIKKLQESTKALEQFIFSLEREKKKTEDEAKERKRFKERRKTIPWPVSGEVVVKFGKSKHPELDTYVISNGIKIKASPGDTVRAVNAGEVIFSGEFRTYGLMVIIDHGGGFYSIYGSLGEILVEEDKNVREGDPVGTVTRSGQPLLYFEIRSENQPEDPVLWLK